MSKSPQFSCTKCGAQYPRWTGRCTECGSWSTVVEAAQTSESSAARPLLVTDAKPGTVQAFRSLSTTQHAPTAPTGIEPFDRVLGGGLVHGSVTLLGGEPGVGKSTLLAQVALALASNKKRILYVTGEESPSQVMLRFRRLQQDIPETLFCLDATEAEIVAATMMHEKPDLCIVDSVQSLVCSDASGTSGSVSQVKASAARVTEAAKRSGVPTILVGQVNKDGDIAGPRLLEHVVDTVLMLEGDEDQRFRIIRALKHRFGPSDEVAVLSMTERGLLSVDDPSAELLRERSASTAGSIVSCLVEGHRPILFEVQALVTPAGYGNPVRRSTGFDVGRLGVLLAVLAKRASLRVLDKDVYANAAGGLRVREPAADLGICLAVASAMSDVAIRPTIAVFGEIGLGGEIRPVSFAEARIRECERHGFTTIIVPQGSAPKSSKANIIEVSHVRDAIGKAMS